jgi:hypothetical protein
MITCYSYVVEDLNQDISKYQKLVFDKFNFPLIQIKRPREAVISKHHLFNYESHANAMMDIIRTYSDEYMCLFDVDCIPLNSSVLDVLFEQIKDNNTLAGALGFANHKSDSMPYIHPCFMGFNRQLYFDIGEPDFREHGSGDIADNFTRACVSHSKKIRPWLPTSNIDNVWTIKYNNEVLKFGHGTIYSDMVYHQFEIRNAVQHDAFIQKCIEII